MKMRFFDFEVFPHWWCCTFGDLPDGSINEDIKDNFVVVRSDAPDARDKLISLMKEDDVCVAGYNIKHYDLSIANAIYQGFTPEQVKEIVDTYYKNADDIYNDIEAQLDENVKEVEEILFAKTAKA